MDKCAQKLLEKFVAEKLDGDLERIRDFDFGTLRDSREFGCSGRGFDAANTRIMHAVYVLLWGDLLPELTLAGCRRKYRGVAIRCGGRPEPPADRLGNFCVFPAHVADELRRCGEKNRPEDFLARLSRALCGAAGNRDMKKTISADAFCFDRFRGGSGVGALSRIFMFEYCGCRSPFEAGARDRKFRWSGSDRELVVFNRSWQMWELLRSRLYEEPPEQEDPEAEEPEHEQTMLEKFLEESGHDLSKAMDMLHEWTEENVPVEERWCICTNNEYEAELEYTRDAWRSNLYSEWWLIEQGFLPFGKSSYKSRFVGSDYVRFFDLGRITAAELDKYLPIDDALSGGDRQAILRRIPKLAKKLVSRQPVWIYVYNDRPVAPPEIDSGYPRKPPLPEDEPDKATLAMLEAAFPEMPDDELLRLEDHIRHNGCTLLGACAEKEVAEFLGKFPEVPAHLRIAVGKGTVRENSDLLPSVHDGQWKICVGCPHFTLTGRVGRCGKRWCCKWGASTPREWNVDRDPMWYHPQCPRIARHFRFEAMLLYCTGREEFADDISAHGDAERLAAERERLLRRDLAAAAEVGDFARIRKRCAELGESFADFAAKYDVFDRMLNFWCASRRLVDNVKLLREEGIAIPETWRDALLALPADDGDPAAREELHRLLENPETR